jgi:hypothetical protein
MASGNCSSSRQHPHASQKKETVIMEEQAPNQALFLNDSPSSFMVLFIAVSFFCDDTNSRWRA